MCHLPNKKVIICSSQDPLVSKLARIRQIKGDPGFYPEAWQSPQREIKEPERYRVYNKSRENFLSIEVTVVETTTEPLKKLIQDLAVKVDSALWLKPYRGIPAIPGILPPFDLVYLDEENRILQQVETYPNPEVRPLQAQPASALVLPAHTVFASRSLPGDTLEFRNTADGGEIEHGFKLVPRPPGPIPPAQPAVPLFGSQSTPAPRLKDDPSRQLQLAIKRLDDGEAQAEAQKNESWITRFRRWLVPDPFDRRIAGRYPLPGLVAYHWTGGTPKAYHIGNISDSGFFLLTEERPFPGTMILMTLQRTDASGEDPQDSIAVNTRVMRWGPDGVGLEFMPSKPPNRKGGEAPAENGADTKALADFLKRLNKVAVD
jgi:hypothetical protein